MKQNQWYKKLPDLDKLFGYSPQIRRRSLLLNAAFAA
jgi:hypothetical protein